MSVPKSGPSSTRREFLKWSRLLRRSDGACWLAADESQIKIPKLKMPGRRLPPSDLLSQKGENGIQPQRMRQQKSAARSCGPTSSQIQAASVQVLPGGEETASPTAEEQKFLAGK